MTPWRSRTRLPWIDHLIRAHWRYWNRLGNQLAASIAFFTMLSIVPILMFAFAILGFTLTVIYPQWLDYLEKTIEATIHAGPLQQQLTSLMGSYLESWRSIGVVATIIALLIASTWVTNLKAAIRGMARPDFDLSNPPHSLVIEYLINMVLVIIIIVLATIAMVATTITTQLLEIVVGWLAMGNVMVSRSAVGLFSMALSILSAFSMFYLIFRFFPEEGINRIAIRYGALWAGISFVLLQAVGGELTKIFALGKATQVLGPVIVVMLVVNLFAQLVLFWTAWVATWNQPAIARRYCAADKILKSRNDTHMVDHHWQWAQSDWQRRVVERRRRLERLHSRWISLRSLRQNTMKKGKKTR